MFKLVSFNYRQTAIQKWGNSQRIRKLKVFFKVLGMMENNIIQLNRIDDNIVIIKVKKDKGLNLEDIFKDSDEEYTPENFDWGSFVGKEVW